MEKTERTEKTGKTGKTEKIEKIEKIEEEGLIRIGGTDISGEMTVYAGLTKIKGIS